MSNSCGKHGLEVELHQASAVQVRAYNLSSSTGLVAYGRSKDTLVLTPERYPVIQRRDFSVVTVFQAELMKPVPYLEKSPPLPESVFIK